MAWGDTGGGYSFRTTPGGQDIYTKLLNRAAGDKRLAERKTYADRAGEWGLGRTGGGGRSNLDAAQGRSWQGVTTHPRFAQQTFGGDQGRGGQGNVYRPSGVHPGRPWKEDEIGGPWTNYKNTQFYNQGPAVDKGIATTVPGQKWADDHRWYEHMRLPSMEIFGKVGDLAKGAMRGSRLHSSYKDAAVAAGGTKAEGSKAWEADKRAMMTDEDQAFYDKYMNLADMAQDNEKAAEYRKTAETAWRNKQTSDRLATVNRFEGYAPDKYRQPGIGLDRMNEIAANLGHNMWYPGEGSPRSTAEGIDATASQMRPTYPTDLDLEESYFGANDYAPIDEDITNDIDFRSGIGQEGGYTEISRPPGGYLDVRDTLSQGPKGSFMFPGNLLSLFEDEVGGYEGQDLEFLLNPEDYYEDLRENEEEIIPNIADLDYFNQFR